MVRRAVIPLNRAANAPEQARFGRVLLVSFTLMSAVPMHRTKHSVLRREARCIMNISRIDLSTWQEGDEFIHPHRLAHRLACHATGSGMWNNISPSFGDFAYSTQVRDLGLSSTLTNPP
jgi:hypothetical protein